MKEQPELETRRLVLRPLMAKDDLSVRELANDAQIAAMSGWSLSGAGQKMCRYWIDGTHEAWKNLPWGGGHWNSRAPASGDLRFDPSPARAKRAKASSHQLELLPPMPTPDRVTPCSVNPKTRSPLPAQR